MQCLHKLEGNVFPIHIILTVCHGLFIMNNLCVAFSNGLTYTNNTIKTKITGLIGQCTMSP